MSPLRSMSSLRTRVPTELDLRWAAGLFETELRFIRYTRQQVALQMHTGPTRREEHERLCDCFGGGSYFVRHNNVHRWRLVGREKILEFLLALEPYFTRLGRARLLEFKKVLLEEAQIQFHLRQARDSTFLREQIDRRHGALLTLLEAATSETGMQGRQEAALYAQEIQELRTMLAASATGKSPAVKASLERSALARSPQAPWAQACTRAYEPRLAPAKPPAVAVKDALSSDARVPLSSDARVPDMPQGKKEDDSK